MTVSSVSTAYLGTAMVAGVSQAQAQLAQLEVETSTGEYADLGLKLGDQSGYELSLRNQDDLLQALTTANGITGANLTTAQNALGALTSDAQTAAQSLATLTPGTSAATLQTLGQNALQQLIATANTTTGDQYLFGGVNSQSPPLADYYSSPTSAAKTAIDQDFQSTFGFPPTDPAAASISASAFQAFLTGPFAAEFTGANWTANWSSASSTNTSAQIAPGQVIQTSTNANVAGFQQLAEGYAMLSEFAGTAISASALQVLASTAQSSIQSGIAALTATGAVLGAAQSQLTQANAAMSSQVTILQTQIGDLDNVDAASVATQLNSLTTQIETAYQLTAQLQKLSLAQYLPT
jgi:flagellar hook-associated protein 3 FlgL